METPPLTIQQQIGELHREFLEESDYYKRHRSAIEDKMALDRINGILDEYWEVTVNYSYDNNISSE